MRIQHNIPAMNALTHYTNNNNALAKNLEKLSSGYKINSAADDAAGLAISEKMRSQIAGLEKAYDNTNDGISLVQTAEGALTEVNSMLTRLKTLATQSANGTYQEEVDREAIQQETNDILDEIDRIAQATNFNGINLLDGSLSGKSQVDNVSISNSTAVAGKWEIKQAFTDSEALMGSTVAGANLTAEDIGKQINYTVTWKDSSNKEQTTTVALTFQGKDGKTVDTTVANNYFTDALGNKYNLDGSGKITKTTMESAVQKGLEADESFNANFKVSVASDKLTIEARNTGASEAKVIGAAAVSNLAITPFKNDGTSVAGDGMAVEKSTAADSLQKFAGSSLKVAAASDTVDQLKEKVFEIDGHKFILTANDLSADAIKGIGEDVTAIELKAATFAAADDTEEIAAEISRVTGLDVKGYTAADTNRGIAAGDIVFTKDKLKLGGSELVLQVGDTNDDFQKVSVKIADMSSAGIGIAGLDLSKQDAAGDAIDTIKNAVNIVSAQRGKLGALQNRLDHTLNNLDAMTENITSSEAQIRDTNMAKEMTAYTKNNILAQAAQSMLAQANSMPQGVLQLLQ